MDKLINQDGKQYRFTPGSNGSLTASYKSPVSQPNFNAQKVSKVVPMLKDMRKRKMAAQTAAVRG